MGLALDEPRDGDETYDFDGLNVIVDPFAMKLIRDSGGLQVRSGMFGPMAELQSKAAGSCGC
jgi:Fe-S cluster assembly iron-binding protein IscA